MVFELDTVFICEEVEFLTVYFHALNVCISMKGEFSKLFNESLGLFLVSLLELYEFLVRVISLPGQVLDGLGVLICLQLLVVYTFIHCFNLEINVTFNFFDFDV